MAMPVNMMKQATLSQPTTMRLVPKTQSRINPRGYTSIGKIISTPPTLVNQQQRLVVVSATKETVKGPADPISLSDAALKHLCKLGEEKNEKPIVLRVGVKSGGCSGMSYVMDFASKEDPVDGDVIMDLAEGDVEIRIDPKSLLYLFGLQLDYSDELIGGGFKFSNPNASSSCGCGTSFSV
uniref:Core domain-containing protein n=1 Tax=Picochlorum oklahomense TaxID=249345 RepID=A0A7S1CTC7_9CHLO|mmetsp:Transcript_1181/g.2413  ORF Transcript_1181/g.2413 Transcript_1181/m.2413 type:complete len:181 (+) Transcript_1181:130-672(+)|eukprot:CAMPEP_0118805710 /NCGR_PEP_ID=MMETSP1161-20130426/28504_1 /TAXON_ID=249345 /ORGANISM="Picochlorum oklahomensis, Strain CCMP2329" /LENGTH=180 /DNA_ID=CAMNT_0006734715 /DNA_START=89 /DNA_END=631 /DNA_ORIENTATION=+